MVREPSFVALLIGGRSSTILAAPVKNAASNMPPSSHFKLKALNLSPQQSALLVFRDYLIEPGEMLCFHGPLLDENRDSLRCLTEQGLLNKDKFRGGYTLTKAGFAAMHRSHEKRIE
jgi:hypothetical protein